jgi:hypothetical protein
MATAFTAILRRALAKRLTRRQNFGGQNFRGKAGAGGASPRDAGRAESRAGNALSKKSSRTNWRKSFPLRKVVVDGMAHPRRLNSGACRDGPILTLFR